MVQADETYRVLRTLPRKGEIYAVRDRNTGITTLRVAAKSFKRDKRRVLVATTADQCGS